MITMFRKSAYKIATFLLAAVCAAAAQWSPVVANIRETTEILREGKTTQTDVKEGSYLRTRDGSTLVHWTRVNGVEKPGTGNLLDNKALLSYSLDYGIKKARQSRFALGEALRPDLYAKVTSLGQDTVAGLPCKLIPVQIQILQAPPRRMGQACVSDKQGLLLKQETKVTRDDGSVVHVVTEMYDVKLNVEPSAKEFDVEGMFEVSRPSETTVPSGPGS